MGILKCKMCGGTLTIKNGDSVAVCEYCETKQTVPNIDDDKRANLYDRACHLFRNNEYDRALLIYEQILNEYTDDAEAYWSIVLCRYGIEYVEDPQSHKRLPTVNRAQFTSIFDDEDYKSAIRYADSNQRKIYEEEAKMINEIQKGILAISQKEEPFDVFICYKETDRSGRRTQDSVLANELYHELIDEGFKVFFSHITLEDKLGTAYEPYIFAALNSASVMVVLGTKPEYFNSVWVKNEWSRYLSLIKNGANKVLIPAYRDMDPYDLPEEFSHLQAQDMSKLGFMQDLIRGIKKLAQPHEQKETVKRRTSVNILGSDVTAPLLKRAFIFLEDGDWKSADEYCERVLDSDPECAIAYVGKLMAELKINKQENLGKLTKTFDDMNNYKKAMRFGDNKLKITLQGYIDNIIYQNNEQIYQCGKKAIESAETENDYELASTFFAEIKGYKDSDLKYDQCKNLAETARKESIYNRAAEHQKTGFAYDLKYSIKLYESIEGWRDSNYQIEQCLQKLKEIGAERERQRLKAKQEEEEAKIAAEKKKKKNVIIALINLVITAIVIAVLVYYVIAVVPENNYNKALEHLNSGDIASAYDIFQDLNNYKDSKERVKKIKEENPYIMLETAAIGKTIEFGQYEQDNDSNNGKEPVEWIVLDKQGDEILLISEYCLDYHSYGYTTTWENCSLRKWLNSDFLTAAFSEEDREYILKKTIIDDNDYDDYNATTDTVFLLNVDETEKYFDSNSDRKASATAYASSQCDSTLNTEDGAEWWLRTLTDYDSIVTIKKDGHISLYGEETYAVDVAVRPAIWVSLKQLN